MREQALENYSLFAGGFFLGDIIMGASTGFVAVYDLKRLVVMKPRLIASYYVFRGTFYCDLLAAVPVIPEVSHLTSFPAGFPMSFTLKSLNIQWTKNVR